MPARQYIGSAASARDRFAPVHDAAWNSSIRVAQAGMRPPEIRVRRRTARIVQSSAPVRVYSAL